MQHIPNLPFLWFFFPPLTDSVRIPDVINVNANMSLGLTLAPNHTGHDFLVSFSVVVAHLLCIAQCTVQLILLKIGKSMSQLWRCQKRKAVSILFYSINMISVYGKIETFKYRLILFCSLEEIGCKIFEIAISTGQWS